MKLATLIPIWVVSFTIHAAVGYSPSRSPEVQIRNGTVVGIYDRGRNQDQFLGIPFAQAPVGALRFSRPQPLEQKWSVPQDARNYGPSCLGVGIGLPGSDSNTSWPESEDCLTINVVRPTKHSCQAYPDGLPVLVWVYGGGFQQGYSGDAKYNLSHLIDMAASSEQPMIGVSFNYRTGILGFGYGSPFVSAGRANIGIHDQRMAYQWIHENIASFGGDPEE